MTIFLAGRLDVLTLLAMALTVAMASEGSALELNEDAFPVVCMASGFSEALRETRNELCYLTSSNEVRCAVLESFIPNDLSVLLFQASAVQISCKTG